jgi:hypothetical protein
VRGRASNLNSTLCQSTEAVWRGAGILTVWGMGGGRERGGGKRKIYFQSGQFFQLNLGWHGGILLKLTVPAEKFF